ncbi:MAG: Smr/MutS family protein, partial [Candidatus Omnitrophota bacterium]
DLIPDYLKACNQRKILSVRLIHGKGTGTLQRTVHAILSKIPEVSSFHLAEHKEGGWGATIVSLKATAGSSERSELRGKGSF